MNQSIHPLAGTVNDRLCSRRYSAGRGTRASATRHGWYGSAVDVPISWDWNAHGCSTRIDVDLHIYCIWRCCPYLALLTSSRSAHLLQFLLLTLSARPFMYRDDINPALTIPSRIYIFVSPHARIFVSHTLRISRTVRPAIYNLRFYSIASGTSSSFFTVSSSHAR